MKLADSCDEARTKVVEDQINYDHLRKLERMFREADVDGGGGDVSRFGGCCFCPLTLQARHPYLIICSHRQDSTGNEWVYSTWITPGLTDSGYVLFNPWLSWGQLLYIFR